MDYDNALILLIFYFLPHGTCPVKLFALAYIAAVF